ncbi:GntR family transcriptional regulator [Aureimonas endophytica]|uniref:GntR family transcriptional regulator n=1 Tax=Aureimonas endophytica TaxID=2027858 RepID=A0A917E7R9_9HYPH|nr:FCD domain-containing protein [Aureimonas endophytica]GGE09132.1 GntR family transcriptional regulator [Aureimonas endophytica]
MVTSEAGRTEAEAGAAVAHGSAVDRLVAEIRELVARRALGIGDALPRERELGEMFGASRNTVREALTVLRAYGLIETRPKVGAVVADGHGEALRRLFSFHSGLSPDSFRDVQGFRRIVETGIGDMLVLSAGPADCDRLDAVNDRILTAATVAERAAADYAFHEALVDLAGNRTMLATYRLLRPVIEEIMRLGKAARPVQANTHEAHGRIVAALRARDRIAFAYRMSRHLEYGLQFLLNDEEGRRPGPALRPEAP